MWRIQRQVIGLALLRVTLIMATTRNDPGEYCEDETFTATCGEDEAVVIDSALYGRMREGRCVSGNYGHIGCAIDVRAHLDRWCSGRPSCEIPVTALLRGATKPCPKDFRSFLEASYTCVKVMSVNKDECRAASFVEVTASEGYISSRITEDTGCGSIDTPWLLKAKAGQKVNITLWDFDIINRKRSGKVDGHTGLPPPCHVYAIIKERSVTSSKTVCPDDSRTSHVFTSLGDTVEIRIVTKKQEEDDHGYFLMHFEAIGCPDVKPPIGGWVKRVGGSALLGCEATDETWRLRCHKNNWIGATGNCSRIPSAAGVSGKIWNVMSSSQGISIAIIIGVAILVGIMILIGGLVCLRWQRSKRPRSLNTFSQVSCYSGTVGDPRSYPPGSTLEKHRASPHVSLVPSSTDPYGANENNYYRTWQLQQRAGKQSIQGTELPPPPYHPATATGSSSSATSGLPTNDERYVEHVYESPKFERRPLGGIGVGEGTTSASGGGVGSGEPPMAHAQYFELDPEAVDHTYSLERESIRGMEGGRGSLAPVAGAGAGVGIGRAQALHHQPPPPPLPPTDREITWGPHGEMDVVEVGGHPR